MAELECHRGCRPTLLGTSLKLVLGRAAADGAPTEVGETVEDRRQAAERDAAARLEAARAAAEEAARLQGEAGEAERRRAEKRKKKAKEKEEPEKAAVVGNNLAAAGVAPAPEDKAQQTQDRDGVSDWDKDKASRKEKRAHMRAVLEQALRRSTEG
jgi:hypothetical protein